MTDPNLLVGLDTGDDAAVYQIGEDLAIIQTVDFFPPIVDDPFQFGEIAAANAISDIYAMGGKPLIALNIVGFPIDLPKDILVDILKGGAAKAQEAGVLIAGGHTIDDEEPKYGLAVTGIVRPGQQITNANARSGDVLVLTKALGTGIITTAGKQGVVEPSLLNKAIEIMSILNHAASDAMVKVGVNACTDVTGYGLIGHLHSMVNASGIGARIHLDSVPTLDGVWDLIKKGVAPGGTHRNLESVGRQVDWHSTITEEAKILLCDAQTSGGLLISVPAERQDELVSELKANGVATIAIIGEILKEPKGIQVVP